MPPNPLNPSQQKCIQCGYSHPPVAGKCPMAKEKNSSGEVIDPTECLRQLKTIITSKMQIKKIKDQKKFYSFLVIQLTKLIEGYNE